MFQNYMETLENHNLPLPEKCIPTWNGEEFISLC
jgi:hypothetical protein